MKKSEQNLDLRPFLPKTFTPEILERFKKQYPLLDIPSRSLIYKVAEGKRYNSTIRLLCLHLAEEHQAHLKEEQKRIDALNVSINT